MIALIMPSGARHGRLNCILLVSCCLLVVRLVASLV
jgi:hypothetical protein